MHEVLQIMNTNELDQAKIKLVQAGYVKRKDQGNLKALDKYETISYVFTGNFKQEEFEGIATILTACNQKDYKKLAEYILNLKMDCLSVLRILISTIDNTSPYNGLFLQQLLMWKRDYENRFKTLLFDLGQLKYIDKLDLVHFFGRIIYGR